jgi:hypothetical protein
MPIPDQTIFGPHLTEQRGVTYAEIRQLTEDNVKLQYLKARLNGFLNNQIEGVAAAGAPFPLTVMTCIAAETLGRVIEPVEKYQKDPRQKLEIPKLMSTKIYGLLDPRLNRTLTKEFKKSMQKIWPADDIKNLSNYSELFHSYLRTSFIHGFRAKNVFLSTELEEGWQIDQGFLVINPNWFWNSYKRVFEECFVEIITPREQNNRYRLNALAFFKRLIND